MWTHLPEKVRGTNLRDIKSDIPRVIYAPGGGNAPGSCSPTTTKKKKKQQTLPISTSEGSFIFPQDFGFNEQNLAVSAWNKYFKKLSI